MFDDLTVCTPLPRYLPFPKFLLDAQLSHTAKLRHPQDTAHARIYDRLLEMCVPISCIGASLRKENAQKKLESMKSLIGWFTKRICT